MTDAGFSALGTKEVLYCANLGRPQMRDIITRRHDYLNAARTFDSGAMQVQTLPKSSGVTGDAPRCWVVAA